MPFIPPYGCPDRANCHPDDQGFVGEGKAKGKRALQCVRCHRTVRSCPGSNGVSTSWTEGELDALMFYRWLHEGSEAARLKRLPKPKRKKGSTTRRRRPATP